MNVWRDPTADDVLDIQSYLEPAVSGSGQTHISSVRRNKTKQDETITTPARPVSNKPNATHVTNLREYRGLNIGEGNLLRIPVILGVVCSSKPRVQTSTKKGNLEVRNSVKRNLFRVYSARNAAFAVNANGRYDSLCTLAIHIAFSL